MSKQDIWGWHSFNIWVNELRNIGENVTKRLGAAVNFKLINQSILVATGVFQLLKCDIASNVSSMWWEKLSSTNVRLLKLGLATALTLPVHVTPSVGWTPTVSINNKNRNITKVGLLMLHQFNWTIEIKEQVSSWLFVFRRQNVKSL